LSLCVCVCVQVLRPRMTRRRMTRNGGAHETSARAHTHTLRIETTTTTVYFVCLFVCFYCHSKFSRVRYAARRRRRNRKCRERGRERQTLYCTYRALVHLLLFLLKVHDFAWTHPTPLYGIIITQYDAIPGPCTVHTDRRHVSLTRIIRRSYLGCLTFTLFVIFSFSETEIWRGTTWPVYWPLIWKASPISAFCKSTDNFISFFKKFSPVTFHHFKHRLLLSPLKVCLICV